MIVDPEIPDNPNSPADEPESGGIHPHNTSEALPEEVEAYRRIVGLPKREGAKSLEEPLNLYERWTYPTGTDEITQAGATSYLPAPTDASKSGKAKKKKKRKSRGKLEIAHQTAGRVRLKIAAGKNEPELLKRIAESFSAIPGMDRITVSPVTGSIILNYNEHNQKSFNDRLMRNLMAQGAAPMIGSEFEELAKKIENQAEFLAERSKTARAVVDFCKRLDREIKLATHNVVDLKIVIAVGVIALTIFEVGANAATPIWLTLSIFTFNHFIEIHNPVEMEAVAVKAPVVFK